MADTERFARPRVRARRMRSLVLSLLASTALLGSAPSLTARPVHHVETLYAHWCANCHGAKLEGGKGVALAGVKLKHGDTVEAVLRSIQEGFPLSGMPGFRATFSAADANALAIYVREFAARITHPSKNLPIDPAEIHLSKHHRFRIETVVDDGLQVPWSFAFLPDGRILLTERAGRLRLIEKGRLLPAPVENIPAVIERDEAGLMAVALAPDYAQSGWIYLSFSDPGPPETAMTKIVRGKLRANRFEEIETIFSLPPAHYPRGYVLFGGRMVFADGHLFFSIGERGQTGEAQNPASPLGKIHRVKPDGGIPGDNPFAGTPGAWPSLWALGVRNPHGLALDPRNGDLWESEHGPRGGDELNVITAGKNYGWPVITYGMNYNGTPISDKTEAPDLEQPVKYWTPSIAASQVAFYTGDRFPAWKNSLFVGSLAQQRLIRFDLEHRTITHEEEIFQGLGRIRDLQTGPDGLLYVLLEQIGGASGRLVRLVPAGS